MTTMTAPPDLGTLIAEQIVGGVILSWGNIDISTDSYVVEIWTSTTNNRTTASLVASVHNTNYFLAIPSNQIKYCWVRASTADGATGDWTPSSQTGVRRTIYGKAIMLTNEADGSVTLTAEEYDEMIKEINFLDCLRGAGVDNWEGYEYALEAYQEMYPEDED